MAARFPNPSVVGSIPTPGANHTWETLMKVRNTFMQRFALLRLCKGFNVWQSHLRSSEGFEARVAVEFTCGDEGIELRLTPNDARTLASNLLVWANQADRGPKG